MTKVDLSARIPNNVDLNADRRLRRALETWQPHFIDWWKEMGPEGFQANEVWLRTAVGVDAEGWANFGHVKMPDYRWGIFLSERVEGRKVGFGDAADDLAWQEVPGELRNPLRRLIVTQGDTEPASVEQQRLLGQTAPSLYDMRNLFQVNVEEGRHLWAMVYLLHGFFGRDGREEAEELLRRRSGNDDSPRILETFNEPIEDWMSFYMFTTFTDRDGKFQLLSLAESGFDPLSRTCRFMLTEEAHHMFVGQTGVERVIRRTAEWMREHGDQDPMRSGVVPLETIQRYLNYWFSSSVDLFGGERSSNAAQYFAQGLKGRAWEQKKHEDHVALDRTYELEVVEGGEVVRQSVPLRNAMNEVLRDDYVNDCGGVCTKWNRVLEENEIDFRLRLPDRKFRRHVGLYADQPFDPEGNLLSREEHARRLPEWIPSAEEKEYVKGLMAPVLEPGKIANWIAPPRKGIKGRPFDYDYVRV
jgi:benzoyl-CoA 2,3-dioxygenase component B